jgi:autotransporter family porin
VRVDGGYRFGGFRPAMFFEPLATISVVDSQIDDFAQNGNTVKFDDGTSVRGRLGGRLGTSFRVAHEITVEPFVVGAVWHEFEGDNKTVLNSAGTVFNLLDDQTGTWGEVNGGLNIFNVGAGASGFAKVDVVLGDDVQGVGGQIGMRVRW